MKYTVEKSLRNFEAWSGGQHTQQCLIANGDITSVEEMLEDIFEDQKELPSETDINDVLWFERDQIAEYLGFEDWETYCKARENQPFKD